MLPDREFVEYEGQDYMSFDIVNSKRLLSQLACGHYFKRKSSVLDKQNTIKDEAIDAYKDINEAQQKKINFLQEDRTRIVDMWKKENKKRHEAENKVSYGWTVSLVLAATTLAFGTAFVLK